MKLAVKPVKFKQVTNILKSTCNNTEELPVFMDGLQIVSCWKMPVLKRIKILFTGRVYLAIRGTAMPPVWVDTCGFVRDTLWFKIRNIFKI